MEPSRTLSLSPRAPPLRPATRRGRSMATPLPLVMNLQPSSMRRIALLATVATMLTLLTVVTRLPVRQHNDDHHTSVRRRLTVFGADDRRSVTDASLYPYSAVGLLKWSTDRNCTASLVGSKYALTAADCVLTRDGTRRPSTFETPELVVGGAAGASIARVTAVHRQSEYWPQWTQETYVLLELDVPLGDTLGTLLLPSAEDLNQSDGKTPVQMVGFDGDVATVAKPDLKFAKCTCYFPATFNGPQYLLHHDCDTSVHGSPGSVLLVRYTSMETYIIGIHTNLIGDDAPAVETDATLAGYSDGVANRGVLGPFIQEHLQALMKNASSDSTDGSSSSSSSSTAGSPVGALPSASPTTRIDPINSDGDMSVQSDSSGTTGSRISAETAYVCIGFVACAWVCILFIVARHVRHPKQPPTQALVRP